MTYLENYQEQDAKSQRWLESELKKLERRTKALETERRQVLNQYAKGTLETTMYIDKSTKFDNDANLLKLERATLLKQVPTLHRGEIVDASVATFCASAKAKFDRCRDFEDKRQFLLEFVDEVEYHRRKVTVKGLIPIKAGGTNADEEQKKISFSISRMIENKNLGRIVPFRN